jgi:dsDNA-binding SOS-regulon protein
MIQLLQSGVATDLQDAYDKAVRLDPNLFETIQQSKQAEVDAQKRAAANKAAKSARAAAVSVRGSAPGTITATKAQDRRSLLAEQFDSMSERL